MIGQFNIKAIYYPSLSKFSFFLASKINKPSFLHTTCYYPFHTCPSHILHAPFIHHFPPLVFLYNSATIWADQANTQVFLLPEKSITLKKCKYFL